MDIARSGEELLKICQEENISLSEYAIRYEIEDKGISREELFEKMRKDLHVMITSANEGMEKEVYSVSGLIGGDAYKLKKYLEKGETLTGDTMVLAMAMALSSSEVNAAMGKIVACPTAGSCGILPAVILSAGEKLEKTDEEHNSTIQWLVADAQKNMMEPLLIRLAPGGETVADKAHNGEEFGYVIKGQLRLVLNDTTYSVKTGESFYYPCSQKHQIFNSGNTTAVFLWISTPPSF